MRIAWVVLLLLVVPFGLVLAGVILIVKGAVLIGAAIAVLALPFVVAEIIRRRIAAARDSAGFARTIKQMQAGTHVPEWQRRV